MKALKPFERVPSSINTRKAAQPVGAYPHARRAGPFLFLSGIGPREPGTNRIPGLKVDAKGKVKAYDIEAECHAMFRNVKAVLQEAGAAWEDIVDVQVFLTDMKRDFPAFNRVYAGYFKDHQPTRTTIEVGALPTPIHVEIKVIAWMGRDREF